MFTVFAGPSLFAAEQVLVSAITTGERGPPFDKIDVIAYSTEEINIGAVGYNVGFDFSYFGLRRLGLFGSSDLLDRFGLTVQLRYSRAAPGIGLKGQFLPALELGGTNVLGGMTFAF